MGVAQRLRDAVSDGLESVNLVTGVGKNPFQEGVNYGVSDVRFDSLRTQVITLGSFGGGDSFKVRVMAKAVGGDFEATDTVAFVSGVNAAASDLQTALRTATGDASLTVSGTTDAGPYTVTSVAKRGLPRLQLVALSGCSGHVTDGTLTYDDPGGDGDGIPFDQESSRGIQASVPLGHSIVTDGTGQTKGTTLSPPTAVSAVGGSGQVVVDYTEHSSGGTSAVVLFAIFNLGTKEWVVESSGVSLEDADGDLTATGLDAGDYALFAYTQTAPGRVSRSAPPEFFTVS